MRVERNLAVPSELVIQELDPFLLDIEKSIAITPPEYGEARKRLHALTSAMNEGLPGQRVYFNGSIEHGDAMTPLNDIDLGVIFIDPAAHVESRHSPARMMTVVGRVIENFAARSYPDVSTSFADQKRSVVVHFASRQHAGDQDFTADVIAALDYPDGPGVLIPNLLTDSWDRSDPVRHTEMVHHANSSTQFTFNKVVRIVKLWSRRNGGPLSSWNIKALALSCLTKPTSMTEGLYAFFHFAAESLATGPTRDPAGIGAPIGLELPRDRVISHVRAACEGLDKAIANAASGDSGKARSFLAAVLGDTGPGTGDQQSQPSAPA